MRSPVPVTTRRRILCVFPAYTPSFGTFAHAYPLMGGVKAFMPPQGLLLIAAYMPETWPVPFRGREHRAAPRPRISPGRTWCSSAACTCRSRRSRTSAPGRRRPARSPCSAGRPSPARRNGTPEFDYLHVGEMGDATDRLVDDPRREHRAAGGPGATRDRERLPLAEFPQPAYERCRSSAT